jgi:hypothetical protein
VPWRRDGVGIWGGVWVLDTPLEELIHAGIHSYDRNYCSFGSGRRY